MWNIFESGVKGTKQNKTGNDIKRKKDELLRENVKHIKAQLNTKEKMRDFLKD